MKLRKRIKEKRKTPSLEEVQKTWSERLDENYKIVNAYGAVLMRSKEFFAYPESLLPASKERVREAIKSVLLAAKEEDISDLKIGYMQLADFIPDADAERINNFGRRWLDPSATSRPTPEQLRELWKEEEASTFSNFYQWTAAEFKRLHKEIDEFLELRRKSSI